MNFTLDSEDGGRFDAAATGLIQDFSNGICMFLTAQDFGPVACGHPNDDENSCPELP